MARGRLLFAFKADLYRLDTEATEDAGGYDADFRETRRSADGSWQGASDRQELAAIRVRCQIEVNAFGSLQPLLSGHDTDNSMTLVFHFRDLERAGLVETSTKDAKIRVNARLAAIYRKDGVTLEQSMPSPGLYAVEAQPAGFGLGARRNLLLVRFKDRDASVRG